MQRKLSRIPTIIRQRRFTLLGIGIALVLVGAVAAMYFVTAAATAPSAEAVRVQGLVNQLSDQDLTPSRHVAMQKLEAAGPEAVDPLVAALHASNPTLRRNSAEMLGFIASPRSLEPLSTALATDSSAAVRSRAAWALGELNDVRAVNALERAAVVDSDAGVRYEAEASLAALQSHLASMAGQDESQVGAFAVSSNAASLVYLAASNKLLISRDAGQTWSPAAGALPSRISALAVSPGNSRILYAGTESQGLLESRDEGTSWDSLNQALNDSGMPFTVTAIALDPGNANRLYVALGSWVGSTHASLVPLGIMETTDGGATWEKVDLSGNAQPVTRLVISQGKLYGVTRDEVIATTIK